MESRLLHDTIRHRIPSCSTKVPPLAKLTRKDFRAIDDAFDMHAGYVLDFSDRTMSEFFDEQFNIDIDADCYRTNGTSKAKRLRTFLAKEDDYTIAKVLRGPWDHRHSLLARGAHPSAETRSSVDVKTPLFDIIARIAGGGAVARTDAVESFERDETLEELVSAIDRDVQANKPEAALDRLHTYCMKKTAQLIETHGGTYGRDDPLHSRMGKYVRLLETEASAPRIQQARAQKRHQHLPELQRHQEQRVLRA